MVFVASLLLPLAELCYLTLAWLTRSQRWRLLFDAQFYRTRHSSRFPALHFIFSGRFRGLSPHPLFDSAWYKRCNPDVTAAGQEPFAHFFRVGVAENRSPHPLYDLGWIALQTGRRIPLEEYLTADALHLLSPHPLFDAAFYLEMNPEARDSGIDPLVHYLLQGGSEGRSPHRLFDGNYYLKTNPDVAAARINPLVHFLSIGASQGRNPGPGFDTGFYMEENRADIGGMNPLVHYVLAGRQQGRATLPDIARYLPLHRNENVIDVIVPVYRGRTETIACIESLLACREMNVPHEIVVINDDSPDAELIAELNRYAEQGRIVLLHNPANLGFPATTNRGIELHRERDVVLLNSDTVVANDWLTRLHMAAWSASRTGTATPFTNNGTICSYPRTLANNPFPSEETASMDDLFREANTGRTHQIPTAVGFCMYIRRDCLADTGLFDAETFGTGYGEENDFCMRASARGWTHVLAADVFVYHRGEVSFSAAAKERQDRAFELVCQKHPNYGALVAEYIRSDPAACSRTAAAILALRQSAAPKVLVITDTAPIPEQAHTLLIRPVSGGAVQIASTDPQYPVSMVAAQDRPADIARVLQECGVSRVYFQDAHWLTADLQRLLRGLNAEHRRIAGMRRQPRRVAALLSQDAAGRPDACAYVRVLLPFGHESVADLIDLIPIRSLDDLNDSFHAVLVQRTAVADDASVDRLLQWASGDCRKIVYETDDNLLAIGEAHPDWRLYHDKQAAIGRLISRADSVIVSTHELAAALAERNERVVTLPNALDERLWLSDEAANLPDSSDVIRALYMGTMTHGDDLRLVREVVERLTREMNFRLELVGVTAEAPEGWYDRLTVTADTAMSYPHFARWLKRQRRWQFAIAPLERSIFNDAKSHLKYLDYAALGLPGVYSAGPVYSRVVQDGVTGILAENTPEAWYRAMSGMVRDAKARRRMSTGALADLRANHTLAAQRDLRRQVCSEVFGVAERVVTG